MRHNLLIRDRAAPLTRFLWAVVVLVVLVVLAYSAALRHQAATLRRNVGVAQIRVVSLRAQVAQADARVRPFRQAAAIAAVLDRQAADPGLLRRLEARVPDDVWFTSLTLSRHTMGIEGRSFSLADIARTVTAIRATPGIASADVTVVSRSAEGWYAFHMVAEPQSDASASR